MSENLITTDNLSKELLKSIFESAMMDVSIDSYGDIMVKDHEKLACVNKINRDYIMVRAVVSGK